MTRFTCLQVMEVILICNIIILQNMHCVSLKPNTHCIFEKNRHRIKIKITSLAETTVSIQVNLKIISHNYS